MQCRLRLGQMVMLENMLEKSAAAYHDILVSGVKVTGIPRVGYVSARTGKGE